MRAVLACHIGKVLCHKDVQLPKLAPELLSPGGRRDRQSSHHLLSWFISPGKFKLTERSPRPGGGQQGCTGVRQTAAGGVFVTTRLCGGEVSAPVCLEDRSWLAGATPKRGDGLRILEVLPG